MRVAVHSRCGSGSIIRFETVQSRQETTLLVNVRNHSLLFSYLCLLYILLWLQVPGRSGVVLVIPDQGCSYLVTLFNTVRSVTNETDAGLYKDSVSQ